MSAARQRAWAALGRERWEIAEREWRGILAESPDDAEAHAALALCLVERERFDEAQREADAAAGLAPDYDFTHYVRGRVLRDRNRFAEAATAVREAIRLDPDDPNNRALLASIHSSTEAWEDCLREADAGLASDPEHDGCTNLRALALTHLGRKDEAAATIAGALQRAPENSLTHANQGWTLLHGNKPKQALDHFREALRLDPGNDWAREGLLTALKAQHLVFRLMLAYFLFMSRQRGAMRWVIFIGIFLGQRALNAVARSHPEWGVVVYPLIALVAVFVFSTWLANPLMNLVMRLDPYGRHALTCDQRAQANLVGCCLLAAAALFVAELAGGRSHLPSLIVVLLALPLTSIHDAAAGWPRRISTIVASAFALIAVFEVVAIHVLRLAVAGKQFGESDAILAVAATSLLPVYVIGLLLWTVLAVAWIERATPER
jgi:tetratricopeptide (TPR) repeat protein